MKVLLRILIIVAIIVLVLMVCVCLLRIYHAIDNRKAEAYKSSVSKIRMFELSDSLPVKDKKRDEGKSSKVDISWKSTEYGFRYLADMKFEEIFEEEVPTMFYVYVNANSELTYSEMGAWAVGDFPAAEQYIAPGTTIANITYKNARKHIYSGYANDGRIFYLKTRVLDGGEVLHLAVLCLLYDKNNKKDNEPLITEVKDSKL